MQVRLTFNVVTKRNGRKSLKENIKIIFLLNKPPQLPFALIDSAPACVVNQVQDAGYFTHFIPECDENDNYKPVQCDYRYSYCWCSDENGNPIPGTTVRGQADCKAPGK